MGNVNYVRGLMSRGRAKFPLSFSPTTGSFPAATVGVIVTGASSSSRDSMGTAVTDGLAFFLTNTYTGASNCYGLQINQNSTGTSTACKYGLGSFGVLTSGQLTEMWGAYIVGQLSGGQATGQFGGLAVEAYVDTGISNAPSTQVIQLASIINGNLSTENGVINIRDYGTTPMGNLFNIMDHTSGTGKLWYGNTIKIRIGSGAKYIPLSTAENTFSTTSTDATFAMGVNASAVGSGTHLGSSRTAAFRVYSDSDEDGTGTGNWRTMTVRHFDATTTQNGELRAIEGVLAGKSVDWNHTCGAVFGSLEAQTAMTISGVMTAAVIGRVGAANNVITVDSDGILCGVGAISNITTGLAATNNQVAAFALRRQAGGSLVWPIGYFVPMGEATIGIQLGDGQSSTTAIGHHVSNGRAIAVWADDNAAALTADAQGINCRLVMLAAQSSDYAASAVRGHLRIPGVNIQNSSQKAWQGVSGVVECSGTYTIGDGTNAVYLCALNGSCELGGTPTLSANSIVTGLHLSGNFTAASYTGYTIGILYEGSTYGFQYAFGFHDGVAQPITTATHSTNDTHKIAVWINGVGTRYIHMQSD